MSKLQNVKGRIYYISSPVRQENLYAVYETTDRNYWTELAKCNQMEFMKSGTEGNCIEARELIIALPESFVDYDCKALLRDSTEHFKQNYGVECIAALHHNKRKTNYHIHLIFSERVLLDAPIEKITSRNMFFDEKGKHVRTKKEILDEYGMMRKGCQIVKKGEVFESNLFSTKDSRFKSEKFLNEVKHSYTELINLYIRDEKDKLNVFDPNGAYLPMKKIGKNNPKATIMESDNLMRAKWNETVDRALVSGVSENQIVEVKKAEISQNAVNAIKQSGKQPGLLAQFIQMAIDILELMISKIMTAVFCKANMEEKALKEIKILIPVEDKTVESIVTIADLTLMQEETTWNVVETIKPESPKQSELAAKYNRLVSIDEELTRQNQAIFRKEQKMSELQNELAELRGWFKGKQRGEVEGKIIDTQTQIANMKRHLSTIVRPYGYQNVKEFYTEFKSSKSEYDAYQKAVSKWAGEATGEKKHVSITEQLKSYQEQVKERESNKEYKVVQAKDRGVR